MSHKRCFHHGFFVKITVLGEKGAIRIFGKNPQYFFIRNPSFHEVGLRLDGNAMCRQGFNYAVAGKVFVQYENQAARCSISQRRASSTTAVFKS